MFLEQNSPLNDINGVTWLGNMVIDRVSQVLTERFALY